MLTSDAMSRADAGCGSGAQARRGWPGLCPLVYGACARESDGMGTVSADGPWCMDGARAPDAIFSASVAAGAGQGRG